MTGQGPAAAVGALSTALAADPGRADLWSQLAGALVAAGRAREAWDAAVRAVELAPGEPGSHRAVGAVAAALDDPRQAESAYRHALQLDPTDTQARAALARLTPVGPSGHAAPPPRPPSGHAAPRPPSGRRRAADPDEPTPWPSAGHRAGPGPDGPLASSPPPSGRRRAPDPEDVPAPRAGRRRAAELTAPDTGPDPLAPPSRGGRRRAPDPDEPHGPGGRAPDPPDPAPDGYGPPAPYGAPNPTPYGSTPLAGGRRRAPEPTPDGHGSLVTDAALGPAPGWSGSPVTDAALGPAPDGSGSPGPGAGGDGPAGVATALGHGPASAHGSPAAGAPAYGATRSPVDGWRQGLVTGIRVLWLVALAGYLGLVDDGVAPFTAGGLTAVAVVLGGYAHIRGLTARTARPPAADRTPTAVAAAGAALTLLVIPAVMVGALTVARTAAVGAVTCATVAALLAGRPAGPRTAMPGSASTRRRPGARSGPGSW